MSISRGDSHFSPLTETLDLKAGTKTFLLSDCHVILGVAYGRLFSRREMEDYRMQYPLFVCRILLEYFMG